MTSMKSSRLVQSFICRACQFRQFHEGLRRSFSTSITKNADIDSQAIPPPRQPQSRRPTFGNDAGRRRGSGELTPGGSSSSSILDILDTPSNPKDLWSEVVGENLNAKPVIDQPHRLYVYAHKHNTHLTFVQPPKPASQTMGSSISNRAASVSEKNKLVDVLLSLSTGNIGFRKSGRGSYDAAYQLTSYTLKQIQERGFLRDLRKLEVVLRGYGKGREAFTKAMLGVEGRNIRDRIVAVMDATRLKHGGSRSPRPRRLG